MKAQTIPIENNTSNATNWLASLDGRTSIAVELKQRHLFLCNDLGGYHKLSYQQKSLVDRVLFLEHHLQLEERKLADGGEFDSGKWVQACNSLSGIFAKLGLLRQEKEVTTLAQYVSQAS